MSRRIAAQQQASGADRVVLGVRVELPTGAPALSERLARLLLRILLEDARRSPEATQQAAA